jgi:hypothetical protein
VALTLSGIRESVAVREFRSEHPRADDGDISSGNPAWGEFISIPRGVTGIATTCEDKS